MGDNPKLLGYDTQFATGEIYLSPSIANEQKTDK